MNATFRILHATPRVTAQIGAILNQAIVEKVSGVGWLEPAVFSKKKALQPDASR